MENLIFCALILTDFFSLKRIIILVLNFQQLSRQNFKVFGKVQKQPPDVLYDIGVLKIFAKLTGKHLRQSLFFNKIAGLRPATLLKKRFWHMFSCEFCQIFKKTFFKITSERLLLKLKSSKKKFTFRNIFY